MNLLNLCSDCVLFMLKEILYIYIMIFIYHGGDDNH